MDFESAYKSLNKAQKQAVDAIYGPVAVIAGPGTGKTQVLAVRIANILKKTDTAPDSILAIAFSESAVQSMRSRLIALIGSTAYAVTITTFHSFCNAIIQKNPEAFPDIIGSNPVLEYERIAIIEKIIRSDARFISFLPRGNPDYYIKHLISAITNIKREGFTPTTYASFVDDEAKALEADPDKIHETGRYKGKIKGEFSKKIERNARHALLAQVYEAYESAMRDMHGYDFDDMILRVCEALASNETLRAGLQEQYQFILIDEHQDTNGAQNAVIQALVQGDESPNVFVVGDDKQAIYRFQGASIQNFLHLPKQYPNTTIVNLDENYRSHQTILDVSHTIAGGLPEHPHITRPQLRAHQSGDIKISLAEFTHPTEEAYAVALWAKEQSEKGSVALIVREHGDTPRLERALRSLNVAYVLSSQKYVLATVSGKNVLSVIRAVAHPHDTSALAGWWLSPFVGIPFYERLAVLERSEKIDRTDLRTVLTTQFPDQIARIDAVAQEIASLGAYEALGYVFENLGVYQTLVHRHRDDELVATVRACMREVELCASRNHVYTYRDFAEHMERLATHDIESKAFMLDVHDDAPVIVMTAHRSKGLEFDSVGIVGAVDGVWSNKVSRTLFDIPYASHTVNIEGDSKTSAKDDDDRRLFYVALTRAKKHVRISWYQKSEDGGTKLPSQFIAELPRDHVVVEDNAKPLSDSFLIPRATSGITQTKADEFVAYIYQTLLKDGLSVTALNNFFECPWRFVFQNSIRMPFAQPAHLYYGSAMHAGLQAGLAELGIASLKDEQRNAFIKTAEARFLSTLLRQPLIQKEIDRYTTDGVDALHILGKQIEVPSVDVRLLEYGVKGAPHMTVTVDGKEVTLPLKGKIDRVDVSSGSIEVIDYKTGGHKSRNEIMGATAHSKGNLFRQLAFYKLLLSHDHNLSKDHVRAGTLLFIEPEKGNIKAERFDLDQSHVDGLKKEIADMVAQVQAGDWVHNSCTEKGCEYCTLGESLVRQLGDTSSGTK